MSQPIRNQAANPARPTPRAPATSPAPPTPSAKASAAQTPHINWLASLIGFVLLASIACALFASRTATPASTARQVVAQVAAAPTPFKLNPKAALYLRAQALGWEQPTTDEIRFTFAGVSYVAQGFKQGVLFTEFGHWSASEIQVAAW